MTTAFTGNTNDRVTKKSSTSIEATRIPSATGSAPEQRLGGVDEPRGPSAHRRPGKARGSSGRVPSCSTPSRRAVGTTCAVTRPRRERPRRRHRLHAGQCPDPPDDRVGTAAADDDLDRRVGPRGEVRPSASSPGGRSPRRQHAARRPPVKRTPRNGQPEQDQERGRGERDRHRHGASPSERSGTSRPVLRAGGALGEAAEDRGRERVDPRPSTAKSAGTTSSATSPRERRDDQAADRHRAQERRAGRRAANRTRPRRSRALNATVRPAVATVVRTASGPSPLALELLTVPRDEQQAVVDREPEPGARDEVEREDRDRRRRCSRRAEGRAWSRSRARRRRPGAAQRRAPRKTQRASSKQQREGDQLRAQEVALRLRASPARSRRPRRRRRRGASARGAVRGRRVSAASAANDAADEHERSSADRRALRCSRARSTGRGAERRRARPPAAGVPTTRIDGPGSTPIARARAAGSVR